MDIIAARAVGEFPLSIATSIALESLLGVSCEDRKFERIPNVDGLLINIRTITRNLLNSIENDSYLDVKEHNLLEALNEEITQIKNISNGYGSGLIIVFYCADYQRLGIDYPHAHIKVPTTAKQIFFQKVLKKMTDRLTKSLRDRKDIDFRYFRNVIDGRYPNRFGLISHQPIDLLSYSQFKDLKLLESHTGAFKPRTQFYTKLHLAKKNPRIPFNRFTIQVFGDNDLFFPLGGRLRFEVNKVAEEHNWHPLTTRDKIRFDLERNTEPTIFNELKKYF